MATKTYTLNDAQRQNLLTGVSFVLNHMGGLEATEIAELEELCSILEAPITEASSAPTWRTLPDHIQSTLVSNKIEEIRECAQDLAHDDLDNMSMDELCWDYGFDDELVTELLYVEDPEDLPPDSLMDLPQLDALHALGMFDAEWNPTQRCKRWLEGYMGITYDPARVTFVD